MVADGERHYKAQYLLTGSLTIYDYSKAERDGVYVVGNFPIFFTAVHLFSAAADIDGEQGEEFIRSAVFNLSGATTDGAELTDDLMAGNNRQVRCDLANQMAEQLFPKLCFMLPGAEAHLQVRGVGVGKQAQEPAHLGERYARNPDGFRQLLAQRLSASLATRLAVSVLPPRLDNDDQGGKKERADKAAIGAASKTQYAGLGVIRYPSAAYQVRYRLRGVVKQPEPQSDGVTVIFGGYSRMKILAGDATLWENDYKSAVTNFIPKRMAVRTNDADWFVMLAFVAANDGVAQLDKNDAKLADMLFQCQTQIQKAGHSQGENQ
ncbi:hypothetical protein FACS1894139_05860 [Planctomycetales bacterium]|nr:hypothetical protein FACS1894107_05320 [Planctomycetales bacterium]GHS97610.1 hypothetical protein FACS1894108_04290 [Planctomycetales bacterium]GHT04165.1 hypothetical protein FACS1894139_05860 [Planctomycetales bacterium]